MSTSPLWTDVDGVEGGFEHPPIVIKSDPFKTLLYLLGAVAIAALFTGFAIGGKPVPFVVGMLVRVLIAVMALTMILIIIRFFRPARVELSPEGIVYFDGFRTRRYVWRDITGVRLST